MARKIRTWMNDSELPDRSFLADILNERGLVGTAVEIGVHRADFSTAFLNRWHGVRFVAVDPWHSNLPGYKDPVIRGERGEDYHTAISRLDEFRDRGLQVDIMRELSFSAAKKFEPNSLDFVYIDANHAYEYVRQDIVTWFPLVKPGGVIAGHDIINGNLAGVRRAVWEIFHRKKRLPVYVISGDAWSWYCFKP